MGDAMSIIAEILRDGPVPSIEAEQQIKSAGVATRTRDRAKKNLRVRSNRIVPDEGSPYWTWELPK